MRAVIIVFFIVFLGSCSRTVNINLSKAEAASLDTVYYLYKNHKFFDESWVFMEKNICRITTYFIRKKTYTGTWTIVGDSVMVSFYYHRKNAPVDRSFAVKNLTKVKL